MFKSKLIKSFVSAAIALSLTGCGSNQTSFSLLGEQNSFSQVPVISYGKIDVLWVIDNSGSMRPSQENLRDNFESFIHEFKSRGIDFRMAIITSDAYRSKFTGNNAISKFRDGPTDPAQIFVITPQTPNLEAVFMDTIMQGIAGNGDERPFQSLEVALENPTNAEFNFPRQDAFLSVILVSDEDDFSHDNSNYIDGQYTNSNLHPVSRYADYLTALTGSTPEKRNFNVNSITISNQTCLNQLSAVQGGLRIGTRYMELTTLVGGEIGSLCDPFAETLQRIARASIELTARFTLNREPNPATIRVMVNGVVIPENSSNGWTYEASSISLVFHGNSIPDGGSVIRVSFDPVTIK